MRAHGAGLSKTRHFHDWLGTAPRPQLASILVGDFLERLHVTHQELRVRRLDEPGFLQRADFAIDALARASEHFRQLFLRQLHIDQVSVRFADTVILDQRQQQVRATRGQRHQHLMRDVAGELARAERQQLQHVVRELRLVIERRKHEASRNEQKRRDAVGDDVIERRLAVEQRNEVQKLAGLEMRENVLPAARRTAGDLDPAAEDHQEVVHRIALPENLVVRAERSHPATGGEQIQRFALAVMKPGDLREHAAGMLTSRQPG